MKTRVLGSQGLKVSEIGLGCMGLSDFYSTSGATEDEAISLIHLALDLGVSFLDTSDAYGPHTNEITVGKALKGRRDGVVVATKFGIVRQPGSQVRGIDGRPEYVRSACDASLARLGVDVIDLYYQHRVDPNTPIEETVGAMAELVKLGKVRYLGLSEAAPATMRRAHKVHPISALQTEYSLWSREPEDEIIPTLRELDIGFVPYSPLGRGFLAGRFKSPTDLAPDDWRRESPRFRGREFHQESRGGRANPLDREREGLHAVATRARLDPRTRRKFRPHTGNHESRQAQGKRRIDGGADLKAGYRAHRGRGSAWDCTGRPLPSANDGLSERLIPPRPSAKRAVRPAGAARPG